MPLDAAPSPRSAHPTLLHTDHVRGALLFAATMLLHVAVLAHDGEHVEDGSYFAHMPYEEACPDP